METLCQIREIYRSLRQFEISFQEEHGISLNEGMLLCCLNKGQLTSSKISDVLGLTNSNASKVIKAAEDKALIKRSLGKEDKRQMLFLLTKKGKEKMNKIQVSDLKFTDTLTHIINIASCALKENVAQ